MVNADRLKALLNNVKNGTIDIEQALDELKKLPFEDLGYAMLDHHRYLRQGCPEVIYCAGKTSEQVAGIAEKMLGKQTPVLATRADRKVYDAVKNVALNAKFHEMARIITIAKANDGEDLLGDTDNGKSLIAVVTAGTSDIPVAEEAAVTAEFLGNVVDRIYDVGVAGIHRLLSRLDQLTAAKALVVAAGMEGALASVVGGLVDKPVIAVPTSVGYGASFNGLSALLTMLNSCASGVGVVNIDNGFGAGYLASMICRA